MVDRVAVLTIDNPPVNALSPLVWTALDEAVARAGDRSERRRDRRHRIRLDVHRRGRHQSLRHPEDPRAVAGTVRRNTRAPEAARGFPQAVGGRDSRQRARGRQRGGDGVSLPRRDPRREDRPARGVARDHPRRRRHAAAAPVVRSGAGASHVHGRPPDFGGTGAGQRAHRSHRGRQSARRRDRVRAGTRRSRRDAEDARPVGQDRRSGEWVVGVPGDADLAGPDLQGTCGAVCRRRGHRGGPAAAVRCRLSSRTRAVRRLRRLDPVESAPASVFRRTRGRESSRRPERYAGPRHHAGGRRRRRHDGRRHRDDVRQRRHSGAAEGRRSGGARSRASPRFARTTNRRCRKAG